MSEQDDGSDLEREGRAYFWGLVMIGGLAVGGLCVLGAWLIWG